WQPRRGEGLAGKDHVEMRYSVTRLLEPHRGGAHPPTPLVFAPIAALPRAVMRHLTLLTVVTALLWSSPALAQHAPDRVVVRVQDNGLCAQPDCWPSLAAVLADVGGVWRVVGGRPVGLSAQGPQTTPRVARP